MMIEREGPYVILVFVWLVLAAFALWDDTPTTNAMTYVFASIVTSIVWRLVRIENVIRGTEEGMNHRWPDGRPQFECTHCGRIVFVSGNYLPIHRHKGRRVRCDGSESHISHHKKLD